LGTALIGPHAHDVGIHTRHGKAHEPRERLEAERVGVGAAHEYERAAPSSRARIAGRHRAVRLERRLQLRQPFRRRLGAHQLVALELQRLHVLRRARQVTRSTGTGVICASNAPPLIAFAAFCWLPSAQAS